MKKLLALFTICFVSLAVSQSVQAQISVGAGLAYGTDIEEIGIQIGGTYVLDENMRLGADLIYYLIGDEEFFGSSFSTTAMEINANFHYIFYNENDLELYGIGALGIHYIKVSIDDPNFGGSESDSELGLGIGAGVQYRLGNISLYAEPRFFLSGFDQLNLSFGVRFGI